MSEPIRVLIVDDEPLARDCVRMALESLPDVTIAGEAMDGATAVEAIRSLAPDIVFLDIQMPGVDGFGVIERVGAAAMPAVIFVTAFDEHAVRAFEIHAFDYILKPFDDARLHDAVRRVREQLGAEREGTQAERLVRLLRDYLAGGRDGPRRLAVRTGDRIRYIDMDAVDFFEAEGNYVRVHAGGATHLIRTTLTSLESQLDPSRFVRIHRSTIVNFERVVELQAWAGGDYVAILRDRRTLRVSRTYRDAVLRPMM